MKILFNSFKSIVASNVMVWIAFVVLFSACGEHNQPAPNKGKNLDSERIYGNVGGEPLQLSNEYEDPEGITKRSKDIYNKMYAPKDATTMSEDAPVAKDPQTETTTEEVSDNVMESTTSEN